MKYLLAITLINIISMHPAQDLESNSPILNIQTAETNLASPNLDEIFAFPENTEPSRFSKMLSAARESFSSVAERFTSARETFSSVREKFSWLLMSTSKRSEKVLNEIIAKHNDSHEDKFTTLQDVSLETMQKITKKIRDAVQKGEVNFHDTDGMNFTLKEILSVAKLLSTTKFEHLGINSLPTILDQDVLEAAILLHYDCIRRHIKAAYEALDYDLNLSIKKEIVISVCLFLDDVLCDEKEKIKKTHEYYQQREDEFYYELLALNTLPQNVKLCIAHIYGKLPENSSLFDVNEVPALANLKFLPNVIKKVQDLQFDAIVKKVIEDLKDFEAKKILKMFINLFR